MASSSTTTTTNKVAILGTDKLDLGLADGKRARSVCCEGEKDDERALKKPRLEEARADEGGLPSTVKPKANSSAVCTFTFTECAENHIGNEQIGTKLPVGPSLDDLKKTAATMVKWLTQRGIRTGWRIELHVFSEKLDAGILILKGLNAVNWTWSPDAAAAEETKETEDAGLQQEAADPKAFLMDSLDWDKKFYNSRRKVVQNKVARHNLCFTDCRRAPDYSTGKGRTYSFADLPPFMRALRAFYSETLLVQGKPLAQPLIAEGNKYYDVASTYIGWHGDVERSIVAGYRVGGPFPLHYWAFNGTTSLTTLNDDGNSTDILWSFEMEDGWGYIMSFGASGQNWRKNCQHLRHAAGKPEVLAKKQERVPKAWGSKKKTKTTAKATPDTFTEPANMKPQIWEPESLGTTASGPSAATGGR